MSEHPQDAGRRATDAPHRVRISGKKILSAHDEIVGGWIDAALVGDAPLVEELLRGVSTATPGCTLACWSGAPGATDDDPFPDDPALWTPAAWAALDESLDRITPILTERGATLLVRPHHRHVIGDVPSVGRLVRSLGERGIGSVGVLLDAESMLADSMRGRDAGDHRRRIREALRTVVCFEIAAI